MNRALSERFCLLLFAEPVPGTGADGPGEMALTRMGASSTVLSCRFAGIRFSFGSSERTSSGVIDTGIWDSPGEEGKRAYFDDLRARNPARRIGTVQDVADTVLYAMTSPSSPVGPYASTAANH